MNQQAHSGNIPLARYENYRLYDGVRSRRVMAFFIDYLIVLILCIPMTVIIAILGVATLGLGWVLFGIMFPVVALTYVAMTMGGRRQATKGMQMMGIRLERMDGRSVDGLFAIAHTVLFWAANALLTPFILLATLFLDHKRAVHDLLLGAVVVRTNP